MISIQKIKLEDLKEFVYSKKFEALENKPISKARALSYLKNPRANMSDIVLYIAFLNKKLVAYRTILSDTFFKENRKVTFGWLSGNWVNSEYRRKGISTLLFNEVLKDWKGKLLYTNYAEASKLVYDKTQQFALLNELKGTRYYTRFCLADILPKKKKIFARTKIFWKALDGFLNLFWDGKNLCFRQSKERSFYVKVNENLEGEILNFTNHFTSKNLFQRSKKEFEWIQNDHWILTDKETKEFSKSYHFSSYEKYFESNIYTIYTNEHRLIGFVFLTVRNGHIKIPYLYFPNENSKEITEFIVDKCEEIKAKTLIIYHKEIEIALNNQLLFVHKKAFEQKYFITKELENHFDKERKVNIQSGDGDVVFT